jgi:hypothetical protein
MTVKTRSKKQDAYIVRLTLTFPIDATNPDTLVAAHKSVESIIAAAKHATMTHSIDSAGFGKVDAPEAAKKSSEPEIPASLKR